MSNVIMVKYWFRATLMTFTAHRHTFERLTEQKSIAQRGSEYPDPRDGGFHDARDPC